MRDAIVSNMFAIAWIGMLLGVLSGALTGLFFHREDWMGGYNSFLKRLPSLLDHLSRNPDAVPTLIFLEFPICRTCDANT